MSNYKGWYQARNIDSVDFLCSWCSKDVGSDRGYQDKTFSEGWARVYICPNCGKPTYLEKQKGSMSEQVPGPSYGREVESLPYEVAWLYDEARGCVQAGRFTAAVLACRKLLMHIAVEKGAEGKNFLECVNHLAKRHYIPPDGRNWVDHIRQKGNEANHEIVKMTRDDAEELVSFLEMLLAFIYEFPSRMGVQEEAEEE